MASFDAVNYALRPNKSIQRQLAFDGIRRLRSLLGTDGIYVGFGSIWFTDFVAAHKVLAINEMYSIESNDIGFERAKFNSPYASIKVLHGRSSQILPLLLNDPAMLSKPWTVWMDYDGAFSEESRDDLRNLMEKLPPNSILLTSFNGHEMSYGRAPDRIERLRALFADVFPDETTKNDCKEERLLGTLADRTLDLLQSFVGNSARKGGFLPCFRMTYRDGAPMVTVGGILPSPENSERLRQEMNATTWACLPQKVIVAPHLTMREAASLQALLPKTNGLTRQDVQAVGFDLDDDQVEAYSTYYLQYPAFAQIVA